MYALNCIRQSMQGALNFDNESLKETILKGGGSRLSL